MPERRKIELFYDGQCPVCTREVRLLRRLDRHERIRFTDITAEAFDPDEVGLAWDRLMKRIHARLADGELVTGVEVFRRLYAEVGLGPVVAVTRLPGISHLLEWAYERFAANRLRLTGRCDTHGCELPPQASS